MFLMYEKHKSFDIKSRPRDFLFIKAAVKRGNRVYLVEKSVEHADYPLCRSIVRANIVSRVTSIIPSENDSNKYLFTVRMTIDFQGMTNDCDNRDMAVKMLNGYSLFSKFCSEKYLYNTGPTSCLFNFKKSTRRLKD